MSTLHTVKSWPVHFEAVRRGDKDFEVRFNDRDYQVGDRLELVEFRPDQHTDVAHPTGVVTGRRIRRLIKHVGTNLHGLRHGHVVLSLAQFMEPHGELAGAVGAAQHIPTPPSMTAAVKQETLPDGRIHNTLVNAKPLTAHERELLTITAEECLEVAKQISKLMRFGRIAYDRTGPDCAPVRGYDNVALLGTECGHVQHMINVLFACGLVKADDIKSGDAEKAEKLRLYLQSKKSIDPIDELFVHEGQG